jgi:cysteine synthase A
MHNHIADAIKTPDLVRLDDSVFVARFETMKVYSALAAVKHLLDTGTVDPGDTLVDSSSGIYAYALALACHKYGMKCHIIGSTTVDRTVKVQLEILGATLDQMPPSASLKLDQNLRVQRIAELLTSNPRLHWMRQYHDDIHYLGYREFADLICQYMDISGLTVVGGVGSGASTGAVAQYLRETGHDVQLCGVQPFGSVTFGSEKIEDPEVIIAGIGSSIPFQNVHYELYDRIHWMSFDCALSGSIDLLRRHAVFAGLSTGAGYAVAQWEAQNNPRRNYLLIAADTGHRYVDAVFSQHHRSLDLAELKPIQAQCLDDLALPWSVMDWGRQRYQIPGTA